MTTRTEAFRDAAPREPQSVRRIAADEVGEPPARCESHRHYGTPPRATVRVFYGGPFGERLHLCGDCYEGPS